VLTVCSLFPHSPPLTHSRSRVAAHFQLCVDCYTLIKLQDITNSTVIGDELKRLLPLGFFYVKAFEETCEVGGEINGETISWMCEQ